MTTRTTLRALAAVVALATGATLATITPAYAADPDPQAPVVVDDTITVWPGEGRLINVLTNDSDPAGDDLAVCRLPGLDLASDRLPAVFAMDASQYGLPAGTLQVASRPNVRGTHTIGYYVCNHTRLTPATLTVVVRPVAPVEVTTVPGKPGRLRVTNHNERRILFIATDRTGCKLDGHGYVARGGTRTFHVHRHVVRWTATIGQGGVADHGAVRHIGLSGQPAPDGSPNHVCSFGFAQTSPR